MEVLLTKCGKPMKRQLGKGGATVIHLPPDLKDKVACAAARRGVSLSSLIVQIITTVFDEGLLGAVLDDKE